MPSKSKHAFDENKKDLDQLWVIHQEISGQGAGRKYGVDVLNRTAIVFVSACWESFAEDLAKEAFDFMLNNALSAKVIPSKVRDNATKPIFDQKNSLLVWDLAGDGWKTVLANHKAATFERWVGSLNTPKTAQINLLFDELVGIKTISGCWHWQGMTAKQAGEKLDRFITVRGNIAHRTEHNETVYKDWGTDFLNHVERLVQTTEMKVSQHLSDTVGKNPW